METDSTFPVRLLAYIFEEPGRFEQVMLTGFAAFVVVVLAAVLILRELRHLRIRWK